MNFITNLPIRASNVTKFGAIHIGIKLSTQNCANGDNTYLYVKDESHPVYL